jgi:putative membrane protein
MLTKNLPAKIIVQFSIVSVALSTVWALLIIVGYTRFSFNWLAIPFLPISLLGIAVSFYLGFKNNASNDRQNEARKNWGSITNDTRAFISLLNSYVPANHIKVIKPILYKHIAWLYAHKFFLRHKRMDWEHNFKINNVYRERFQKDFGINTELEKDVTRYLTKEEFNIINKAFNKSSKILQLQSHELKTLREQNIIDDFRLFELQNHITKLYEHQGKNERLKTFPVPRQYAKYAYLFVLVFVTLLPMGLLSEMQKINIWLTIPFSVLISWVFMQMEMIADYSENPFEGLILDIPMTAITRNLEIEILESLDENNIPVPVQVKDGILM